METLVDPKKADPILNPIPRTDNPYLYNMKAGYKALGGGNGLNKSVFQGAAKSLLNQ